MESLINDIMKIELDVESDIEQITYFLNRVRDIFIPSSLANIIINEDKVKILWGKVENIFLTNLNEITKEDAASTLMYFSMYCSIKKILLDKSKIRLWLTDNKTSCLVEYIEEIMTER